MPPIVRFMAGSPLSDAVVAPRPWDESNADELAFCLDGDEEIGRWLDQIPQPYTREDALAFVRGTGGDAFAVTDAASGRVLGSIGVRWNEARDVAEVGYWLRACERGRGTMGRMTPRIRRQGHFQGLARQLTSSAIGRAIFWIPSVSVHSSSPMSVDPSRPALGRRVNYECC